MRRGVAALVALLAIIVPKQASADSPIQTIAAKTPAPVAGSKATFQLGLTSVDGTTWDPQTYTISISALDSTNKAVATTGPVNGDVPIVPGQTAFVFIDLQLPSNVSGQLTVVATVTHNGKTDTSSPIAIGVSTAGPAAPGKPAPVTGKMTSTTQFKLPVGQDNTLDLTAKTGISSVTGHYEISTTPGAQPLLNIQTPGTLSQFGAFAPSFDPLSFSGVTGNGGSFMRSWSSLHSLQFSYISAGDTTLNPFQIMAVGYTLPIGKGGLTITAGFEHTSGQLPTSPQAAATPSPSPSPGQVANPFATPTPLPLQAASGQPFFMASGRFASASYQLKSDTGVSYGFRYSLINYFDSISGGERTDRAFETDESVTFHKILWTFDYTRAGAFYPNLTAPGVTPDRESASLSAAFKLGLINTNLSVNGYRDGLGGSVTGTPTHYLTEALAMSTTVWHGDQVGLNVSNGILHQNGDPLALMQGNDSTALTYAMQRGQLSYQFGYTSANQRDDQGNLTHTIQESVTVSRNVSSGFSVSVGVNGTNVGATAASGTSWSLSENGSITYTAGMVSLSAAIARSYSLPYVGDEAIPGIVITYGFKLQPPKWPFGFSGGVTQNTGPATFSTGTFGLVQTF